MELILWRGALPRTGGTVIMALIELLLKRNSIPYQPVTPREICDLQNDFGNSPEAAYSLLKRKQASVLIGTQENFVAPLFQHPPFKIIFVRRDIRDAIASLVQLTRSDFSTAIVMLKDWIGRYEELNSLPSERLIKLDYETEVLNISDCTKKLSNAFGLRLNPAVLEEADQLYTRHNVKKQLSNIRDQTFDYLQQINLHPGEPFFSLPIQTDDGPEQFRIPIRLIPPDNRKNLIQGNITHVKIHLAKDTKLLLTANQDGQTFRIATLDTPNQNSLIAPFNSEHVSATRNSWRTLFSQSEKEIIQNISKPFLLRHGFNLE